MKRLLAEPLLHFTLLGGLLFASSDYWQPLITGADDQQPIVISSDIERDLARNWLQQTGRLPNSTEKAALTQQYIAEEILFREALRLNLHEQDPVIRLRLAKNMQFVDQREAEPEQLVAAALALGMLESDLVVRRRLIQRMQHRIESQVTITQAEILDYLQANRTPQNQSVHYSFRHIFFSDTERNNTEAAAVRAQRVYKQLSSNPDIANHQNLGDAFPLGTAFSHQSMRDVRQQLGDSVAEQLAVAEAGQWSAPIASVYGQHLIWLDTVTHKAPQPTSAEQKKAAAAVFKQKEQQALKAAIADLQKRYRIVAAEIADTETANPGQAS